MRMQRERLFSAHHMMLNSAYMAVEAAENKKEGWLYPELIAITFSALAVEAMANAIGLATVDRWDEFESASPLAKIRIIGLHLHIDESRISKQLRDDLCWLIGIRNTIAHAKPEPISSNRIIERRAFQSIKLEPPSSELELELTPGNARRAWKTAQDLLQMLCERVPPEKSAGLLGDMFTDVGSAP